MNEEEDSDDSDTDAAKINQKMVLKGMSKLLRKKKRKLNPFAALLKISKKKNANTDQGNELQDINIPKNDQNQTINDSIKLDISKNSDDSEEINSERNTEQIDNLEL